MVLCSAVCLGTFVCNRLHQCSSGQSGGHESPSSAVCVAFSESCRMSAAADQLVVCYRLAHKAWAAVVMAIWQQAWATAP